MIEKMKKDKLKTATIGMSLLIFIVGLVVTIVNSGGTFAVSASDYTCSTSGYEVVSDDDGNYYCCPEGYHVGEHVSGVKMCFEDGGAGFSSAAAASCDYKAVVVGNYYYCAADVEETEDAVTCAAGDYYSGQGTCSTCVAGYYCPGGTFSINDSSRDGIYQCPSGSTSSSGAKSSSDCKLTCAAGEYYSGQGTCSTCVAGYYCPGGSFSIGDSSRDGIYQCPDDSTSSAGAKSSSDCKLTCAAGEYYSGQGTCSTCVAGYYCPGGSFSIGDSSRDGIYQCPSGSTSSAGAKSSSDCKATTYTISYNANGGSGAPSSQTKTKDVDLTLSSTKPTRSGFTFKGWAESATATTAKYQPGGTYSANSAATLYAVWDENEVTTYTVSYDANGGSGAPSSQIKTKDVDLTLSSTKPTRSGFIFLSWNTAKNGSGTTYSAGGTYSANSNVTLYAVWKEESVTTYTVSYDANGGSGAPSSQTGSTITISSTKPTKNGYTFVSWNTEKDGSGTSYVAGSSYTPSQNVMLYAQYKENEYKISYTLNGGIVTGNPTTATYDEEVLIKNPTKTVTITGNANKTDATIGKATSSVQEFAGWTSTTINISTAYYGDTAWTDGNTKVTATTFKNLTPVNGATVTMVANWIPVDVTVPIVSKDGYTCKWNTNADGSGDDYASGSKYTPSAVSSSSINLYAICDENTNVDEELEENIKTGDVLIVVAWLIGVCALCYSVYYFRSNKNNI